MKTLATLTLAFWPLMAAAQEAPATPPPGSAAAEANRSRAASPVSEPAQTAPPPAAEPSADDPDEAARTFSRLMAGRRQPYPPIEQSALTTPPAGQDAEIQAAIQRYKETGDASVIKRSDRAIYPYDESQPVILCSPLRACDIELQPGEVVTGVALGDSERWLAAPLTSGDVDEPTPHVILKPREYDATTNLVVATSRRTYHIGLHSPSKEEVTGGKLAYYRHVSFYYPAETVQEWARLEDLDRKERTATREARTETLTASGTLDIDALNFAYTTKAHKKATWAPTNVFDDGHHVYIELPTHAVAGELPALLVEAPDGTLGVANYRVNGRWYVVDTVFRKALLVRGVGRKKKRVEITNLRAGAA